MQNIVKKLLKGMNESFFASQKTVVCESQSSNPSLLFVVEVVPNHRN
jgi:hypothetical protein